MTRLACLVALVAVPAFAQLKPGQEEQKAKFDKQLAAILKDDLNPKCGTSFTTVASDFENWAKADFPRNPAGSVCSTLTYAVQAVCAQPAYKKALQARLKGLACVMGGNKTDPKDVKARFFVKDGVFTFKMDADGAHGIEAADILRAWLDG